MVNSLSFLDSVRYPNRPVINFFENYFAFGRTFKVLNQKENLVRLELEERSFSSWKKVCKFLKTLSYFTLVIPLIFGAIKALFRLNLRFEMIEDKRVENLEVVKEIKPAQDPKRDVALVEQARVLIEKARGEGKKIALFVGREPHQTVPKDDGTFWISVSNYAAQSSFTEMENERGHLVLDFHQIQHQIALMGQFDQIIVDWSTIKFFLGTIRNQRDHIHFFTPFLAPGAKSELIFEASAGFNSFSNLSDEYDHNYASHSFPLRMKNKFSEERMKGYEIIKINDTRVLLESIFDTVELHEREPHPGREANEIKLNTFWVVRGLTKELSFNQEFLYDETKENMTFRALEVSLCGEPLKWSFKPNKLLKRFLKEIGMRDFQQIG